MAAEKGITREKAVMAAEIAPRGQRLPWPVLAVNIVLMALILIGGFLYTRRQISQIQIEKKDELRAIAALKTSQIRHWLDEILDDGRFLRSSINFNAAFMEKLKIKPAVFQKIVTTWIKALKDFEEFAEIRFLDLQGRPVWRAAGESEPADPALAGELQAIFTAGEVSLSDIYFSKALKRIDLSLRVPVSTFSASGRMLPAVILLSVDPVRFLFPLIQSWPTASPSAETLLVRRESDEVVYLNELRHRKNTTLRLRYPIAKKETPAARAARGEVGFVTGPDYRDVPVMADIHHIPGTSWSLIAKIDQEEMRLLVARQEWVMYVMVFSAFLLIILFTSYSWHRQQIRQLRHQVEADTALNQSENRYRLLIENQGEGIGLVNTEDRFIFANPAADELFGMEPGKLTGRTLQEFVSAADFEKIRNKTTARSDIGKESYELKIIRPDGGERILHVTVTPRIDESGQFSGVFGIFSDISDRKHDEEKIRKMLAEKELLLKEVHHRVKNNMMVIGSLLQIQAQRVNDQKTITILQESQNRIHAMMTIYEKLYRATDLTHIGLGEYFSELAGSLFAAYNVRPGTIDLETAISDIELDIDRTIPCGLIINELVSNTLKYAFPGDRKGHIRIEFHKIEAGGRGTKFCAPVQYALIVANDGVPLPAGFDIAKSTGFGLQLINMLAGQLGGKLRVISREWTEFEVIFPQNHAQ
ncbi:MAG: PAS domain S-box protein [Candidatus Aminicenantes bacterium]|nr:PAS domain S-box protein [Candidatus Aminicenantes bacterium]